MYLGTGVMQMATTAKATKATQAPAAGHAATKANKRPSKGTSTTAPAFVPGVGFTAPSAQAPATQAAPASPLPTVGTPTLQSVPATTVQVPAQYMGLPFAQLTKSQQAFATAKRPVQVAPKLAAATLALGPVAYKVRSGNNAHWWACVQQALAQGNGSATAAQMVAAGACPKFVGYAVNRKWLAAPVAPLATV